MNRALSTGRVESLPAPHTFEIGLTMAGAVSGGAYTAGVLDFLVEALDAWEQAREREADLAPSARSVPWQPVVVNAASGASAGSMCTAILGAVLSSSFPHVRARDIDAAQPLADKGNPLFDSWVRQIRIEDLLTTGDDDGSPLASLLNSQPVDRILERVLAFRGPPLARAWVADPLTVRFSVTNLRGVSYDVGMCGNTEAGHAMRHHADHLDFQIPVAGGYRWQSALPELASATVLAPQAAPGDPLWQRFGLAALASGAFPFALKPRRLERAGADYAARQWPDLINAAPAAIYIKPRPLPERYAFYAMDGGLTDNEPFELARQVQTGGPWDNSPRNGGQAHRAVIMIDPFVEDVALPADEAGRAARGGAPRLAELLMPLFEAWKLQCRFKPGELVLANNEAIYSRFIIAPARGETESAPGPLAAGGLGAFFGFFHQAFRVHDFLLGRRNCQKFLKDHFALPLTNPIIAAGYGATHGAVLPQFAHLGTRRDGDDTLHYPIVPLVGALATQIEVLPEWPAGCFDPDTLRGPLEARVDYVIRKLGAELGGAAGGALGWLVRRVLAGPLVRPLITRRVVNAIVARLAAELGQMKL